MKSGRPSFHIPGRWVVISIPGRERVAYKLDNKGNPVKTNGRIQPDPTFDWKKADEQRKNLQFSFPKLRRQRNIQASSVISQPMTPNTAQYFLPVNSQVPPPQTISVSHCSPPMYYNSNNESRQPQNVQEQPNIPNPSTETDYINNNLPENDNTINFANSDDDDLFGFLNFDFD